MLDDDDYVVQPTPSPKASPAFRRLRKGPRPQVTLSSVPEGEEQHNSVAHQVFPDAAPAVNISASEARAAEDIGHQDNVENDEVLPQIEHNVVSSHVLTNSELISIGRPLTPIAQDDSWADHP